VENRDIRSSGEVYDYGYTWLASSKPVREELENYSKLWEARGGIKTITLYRVDVVNRVYYVDAMGTLEEIIEYIESMY